MMARYKTKIIVINAFKRLSFIFCFGSWQAQHGAIEKNDVTCACALRLPVWWGVCNKKEDKKLVVTFSFLLWR